MAEEIENVEETYQENVLKNYAKSSDTMLNGNNEERKMESNTYNMIATHVEQISNAEQRAFESDREFQMKKEKNDAEIAKINAETENIRLEREDKKHNSKVKLITYVATTVLATAITGTVQIVTMKKELDSGRSPISEKKTNAFSKVFDKLTQIIFKDN